MAASKTQFFRKNALWILTLLRLAIFNKGMQVESKSQIKWVQFKIAQLLLCNTSLLTL